MFRAGTLLKRTLPALRPSDAPDDRGQTLVEYALLLLFLAVVVIAVLLVFGPTVSGMFQSVNDQVP